MNINILAFGIVKDIVGGPVIKPEANSGITVAQLKELLEHQYPRLGQLASYMIAVNNEYAGAGTIINELDEVAIIPPVSGG